MQPVGQLDEHHTHIAVHGQEGFAQGLNGKFTLAIAQGGFCFRLWFFFIVVFAAGHPWKLGQFGHSLDQTDNPVTEIAV